MTYARAKVAYDRAKRRGDTRAMHTAGERMTKALHAEMRKTFQPSYLRVLNGLRRFFQMGWA